MTLQGCPGPMRVPRVAPGPDMMDDISWQSLAGALPDLPGLAWPDAHGKSNREYALVGNSGGAALTLAGLFSSSSFQVVHWTTLSRIH